MPASKITKRPGRKHYYTWIDGRYVSTGQTDQRLALQAASRMAVVGVEAFRRGKQTLRESLPDLIESHLEHLAKHDGRGVEHIRKKRIHLMRPIEDGAVRTLKDVKKPIFEPWLNDLGCGPKTRNEYLTAWYVFLDWLVYEGRLNENPIRGRIRRARVVPQDTRRRRAFTLDEIGRLLSAAGPRELLYMTAATTGARFNELKQLLWADVHEADAEPHIVLRAATTKNRKGRTQHITAELASALARARPRAMTPRVFRRMPSHHTIDKDIRSAGIAKRTDDGIACFHSLRHTFTTMIARQTGDARLAQRMADHADITTTQRYMHTERQEHAAVMQSFPPLRATRRASGVVQNGPNVPVTVSTSPLENIVQVSGSEGF